MVGHGVPVSLRGEQEVPQLFLHQLRAGDKAVVPLSREIS